MAGEEFVRRFLLHVLPKGLMRIRHYRFLVNRSREQKLTQIRQWLQQPLPEPEPKPAEQQSLLPSTTYCCPKCHKNTLQVREEIKPKWMREGRR